MPNAAFGYVPIHAQAELKIIVSNQPQGNKNIGDLFLII